MILGEPNVSACPKPLSGDNQFHDAARDVVAQAPPREAESAWQFAQRVRRHQWRRLGSEQQPNPMKYWKITADKLSKAGWSWGYVSAIDSNGRTVWIADAHRNNGNRFVVHADEKLIAFMELEAATLGYD
jgi:hypothetical protein